MTHRASHVAAALAGVLLCASPAAARLAPGDTCALSEAVRVSVKDQSGRRWEKVGAKSRIEVLGKSGAWLQVKLPHGKKGRVNAGQLEKACEPVATRPAAPGEAAPDEPAAPVEPGASEPTPDEAGASEAGAPLKEATSEAASSEAASSNATSSEAAPTEAPSSEAASSSETVPGAGSSAGPSEPTADAAPAPAPRPAGVAAEEAPKARLVAVLDLKHDEAAAPLAGALAAVLTSEIAARPEVNAVSRNELASLLTHKADAALLGCDTVNCAADVGRLVDAELIVTGSLERIEGGDAGAGGVAHVLTLSLIDVAAPAVKERVEATWRGAPEEMVTAARPLVDRLFGGAAAADFTGALEVFAEAGARVFLDGRELGTAPLSAPVQGLPIGVHVLEVSRPGFVSERRDVVVSRNETTVVRVELSAEPLLSQWWFWTAVGGGAAVTVAAGATLGTLLVLSNAERPTTLLVKTPLPAAAR